MRNMNVAIDEVRRAEAAQMKQDGYEPSLTKSRWCLLKRRKISPTTKRSSSKSSSSTEVDPGFRAP